MFFPLLYSETHYHLRFLFPRYYKNEPEVLFDFPLRVVSERTDNTLIFFLIVKDADNFPGRISDIKLDIFCHKQSYSIHLSEEIDVNEDYYFKQFRCPINQEWINQSIYIKVYFKLKCINKIKTYINDNYYGNIPHQFKVFISKDDYIYKKNWYRGDVHYHSNYTSDQVEFGAPIEVTKVIANAMGIDWFFVTDHSYDLDDLSNNYLKNDPDLSKWHNMREDCRINDRDKMRVISGEEVSIGNSFGENIHLLAINEDSFIKGSGDSAENWFKNKPENDLSIINDMQNDHNLFIAAHPFDKVPISQKLLLNRGNWSETDFKLSEIKYLQIINGQDIFEVKQMVKKWIELLLEGNKYYILAGNDAHGNFQFMKQISIPFLKLMCRKQQLFGQYFTMFYNELNDPIKGIKKNRVIISNGPFIEFFLDDKTIGETFLFSNAVIRYDIVTNLEFGGVKNIILYIGNIETKRVIQIKDLENNLSITLPKKGFCILSLETKKGFYAITNPIYIEVT
jgi:hypothetical protein